MALWRKMGFVTELSFQIYVFLFSLWGLYIANSIVLWDVKSLFPTLWCQKKHGDLPWWMFLFPSQNLHFIPLSPAGHVWLPEGIGCSSGVDDMKKPNLEGLAINFENFGTWFMSNHWSLGASLTGDKTNNEDVTIMDGLVEKIDRKLFILCLQ